MEPERNWSSWYDYCGAEDVTSCQREAQGKRQKECERHRRGEDVKSAPRKRAREYCVENENIKRGKRKEWMSSSSISKEGWKDWQNPSEGDKWDTHYKNYSQGEDVRVGEHVQERFRKKEG